MTREEREEAVKSLSELREAYRKYGGGEIHSYNNKLIAFDAAIDVLRGPVPDPVTGLVDCGCGGKAYMADWSLFNNRHLYSVHCLDCNTQTDHCETKKIAKARWNTACGYKEGA
jgi:hypothetical protein